MKTCFCLDDKRGLFTVAAPYTPFARVTPMVNGAPTKGDNGSYGAIMHSGGVNIQLNWYRNGIQLTLDR
jgi:hypothetical protein